MLPLVNLKVDSVEVIAQEWLSVRYSIEGAAVAEVSINRGASAPSTVPTSTNLIGSPVYSVQYVSKNFRLHPG